MMKKTGRSVVTAVALVLLLTICIGTFTGCSLLDGTVVTGGASETGSSAQTAETGTVTVTGVTVVDGSIIVSYSDGSIRNIGSAITNVTNNDITVDAGTTEQSVLGVSKALLSTVGVECSFTRTVTSMGGYPFGGTSTREETYGSAGSGVIYQLDKNAGDAYIITNFHVVYSAYSNTASKISNSISVYLWGSGETEPVSIPATFIGGSDIYDIAILKVTGSAALRVSAAEAASIGNSDKLAVGQSTLVIGNPEAEGISATAGILSVDSEYIEMSSIVGTDTTVFRVMRIDAAVNSGNSGGGLYDCAGNLIGIVNAKVSDDAVENIGYAIPVNIAVGVAQNVIDYHTADAANQTVYRAIIGITPGILDSKMTFDAETGLTTMVQTLSVSELLSGSLAEAGGVQVGDVLLSVKVGSRDEKQITRRFHLIDEMLNARVGDVIELKVQREGSATPITIQITVTTGCLESW